MGRSKSEIVEILVGSLLIGIIFASMAWTVFLYSKTIASVFLICSVGVAAGFVCGLGTAPGFRRITFVKNRVAAYIVSSLMDASVVAALFLTLNYYCSDSGSSHKETVEIEDRYTQRHEGTRKVGKHRYQKITPYNTYHIRINIGGREKNIELTEKQYSAYRDRNKVELTLERGLFGMDVIKEMKPAGKSPAKKRHYPPAQFPGRHRFSALM